MVTILSSRPRIASCRAARPVSFASCMDDIAAFVARFKGLFEIERLSRTVAGGTGEINASHGGCS